MPPPTTLLRHETLGSTSDEARRLLRLKGDASPPVPFVVWAARQTKGRGRRRSAWWSDAGSLTFTLAFDPSAYALRADHGPRLSLVAALAILDAIEGIGLRVPGIGIRWPNDVEVGDRKLAGILPETVETAAGRRFLIGIGLNVATRFDAVPAELARTSVSLTSLGLDAPDPDVSLRLLESILDRLGPLLRLLVAGDPELERRWNAADLLRDQLVVIDLGPRTVVGHAAGIGPDGTLRIVPEGGGAVLSLSGGRVVRDRPLI